MTPDGLKILKHALCMNGPRKLWGTQNSYTAATTPPPAVRDLITDGYIRRGDEVRPGTTEYKATTAGMRKVGLGPAAIERASKL